MKSIFIVISIQFPQIKALRSYTASNDPYLRVSQLPFFGDNTNRRFMCRNNDFLYVVSYLLHRGEALLQLHTLFEHETRREKLNRMFSIT